MSTNLPLALGLGLGIPGTVFLFWVGLLCWCFRGHNSREQTGYILGPRGSGTSARTHGSADCATPPAYAAFPGNAVFYTERKRPLGEDPDV